MKQIRFHFLCAPFHSQFPHTGPSMVPGWNNVGQAERSALVGYRGPPLVPLNWEPPVNFAGAFCVADERALGSLRSRPWPLRPISEPPLLCELGDFALLQASQRDRDVHANDKKMCVALQRHPVCGTVGCNWVQYRRTSSGVGGRCESSQPAYRGVSQDERLTATSRLYVELDFSKCHPCLMAQLAQYAGLYCPCLFEYTASREAGAAVLARLVAEYKENGVIVTAASLKGALSAFPMGRGTPAPLQPALPWLHNYHSEVVRVRECAVAAFPWFLEWARVRDPRRTDLAIATFQCAHYGLLKETQHSIRIALPVYIDIGNRTSTLQSCR